MPSGFLNAIQKCLSNFYICCGLGMFSPIQYSQWDFPNHVVRSPPSLSLPLPAAVHWRAELEAQKTDITGCDKKIYWRHWDKKINSNNINNKIVWNRECGARPSCCHTTQTSVTPPFCPPRSLDWKEPLLLGSQNSLFCCPWQWCEMI